MNHFTFSALLTSIFSLGVCLLALTSKRDNIRVNRLLALYWLCLGSWSFVVGLQAVLLERLPDRLWGWMLHLGALFIAPTFFHFALVLAQRVTRHRGPLILVYGLSGAFLLLNSFTEIFTHGTAYRQGYAYPIPAFLYPVFFISFVAFVVWGTILIFRHAQTVHGAQRGPLFSYLAAHIFACVGGMDNFAIMWDITVFPLFPFGLYAVVLYALVSIYAIRRNAFSASATC